MRKSKRNPEVMLSLELPAVDEAYEVAIPLDKELRRKFGRNTSIGGSGSGFGKRDYNIYTLLELAPKVERFLRSFLEREGFSDSEIYIDEPLVWDGDDWLTVREYSEYHDLNLRW